MNRRGELKYIPKELLEELDNIKINFNVPKDSNAFRKMVEFSEVGRELTINLNFERKKRRNG
jgi:hypothetical protein